MAATASDRHCADHHPADLVPDAIPALPRKPQKRPALAKGDTTTDKAANPRLEPVARERALGAMVLLILLGGALAGCTAPPPADPPPTEPVDRTDAPPPSSGPNRPPVAAFDWSPLQPRVGETVTFTDRSTDADDGVAGRVWQASDDFTSRLARATHAFLTAGEFTVRLTVSDRAGATNMTEHKVRVLAPDAVRDEAPGGPRPHVVVAVVDTGINPYHQAFRASRPAPASYIPGYPANATSMPLTLGPDYAADVKADDALWKALKVGELRYVPGTRIVGVISFGLSTYQNAAANTVPVLDEDGHGSCTSSRVALSGPDVDIVMVETGPVELDQALAWASSQPWIDIVSVSIGPLFNLPLQWPGYVGDANPTKAAWDSGKLVFAAAGNDPSLSITSYLSGPQWVVSVGGALPQDSGDPATASKAMDVVSDYRPSCADHDSVDGVHERAGTSFGTPTVAGAVGQALHAVRAQVGWLGGTTQASMVPGGPGLLADGLTNAELRAAMNAVAHYWETGRWSLNFSAPIAPAPWVQMGWGYIGPDDGAALAQVLLAGTLPEKPAEAQTYMDAVQIARIQMWG